MSRDDAVEKLVDAGMLREAQALMGEDCLDVAADKVSEWMMDAFVWLNSNMGHTYWESATERARKAERKGKKGSADVV